MVSKWKIAATVIALFLIAGCSGEVTPSTPDSTSQPAPSGTPTTQPQPSPDSAESGWFSSLVDWLSSQPTWIWLLVAALVTHRLTLRREKWNREQARRTEQRKAIADFSAAVNGAAPDASDLAIWIQRRQKAATPAEENSAIEKLDASMSAFAEKIFDLHRAADMLKMTLVDPELSYRATFALKLTQDLSELGGDRRLDPSAQVQSLPLLEYRCTETLKQLMNRNDDLLSEAVKRIRPQTTWFSQRQEGAHYTLKSDELEQFRKSVEATSASIFRTSTGGKVKS